MKGLVGEFKEFVNRGNLVDLAIAVVLATAFAPVIAAIVDGVIMNLIAAIFGQPDFSAIRLRLRGDEPEATYLELGLVITTVVQFLTVALVCFVIVKAYNRMQKPQVAEAAAVTETDLLVEIRDELRKRPLA
ncbi:large conductance mechanosensitive channel protein MscL [soil metagenome]